MSALVSKITVFHVACTDCGWGIEEFADWRAEDKAHRHNAEFHGIPDPRISVHDLIVDPDLRGNPPELE